LHDSPSHATGGLGLSDKTLGFWLGVAIGFSLGFLPPFSPGTSAAQETAAISSNQMPKAQRRADMKHLAAEKT